MNKQNKENYDFIINNNTVIEGHMAYFIDYANKMYFPLEVRVGSDWDYGKYICVKSRKFLMGDEYSFFVQFDNNGMFVGGDTYFSDKHRSESRDQNEFKQILKKEINKLNVIHGTAAKMLNE